MGAGRGTGTGRARQPHPATSVFALLLPLFVPAPPGEPHVPHTPLQWHSRGGGTAVPHHALRVAAGDDAAAHPTTQPPRDPGTDNRPTTPSGTAGTPARPPEQQRDPQHRRGKSPGTGDPPLHGHSQVPCEEGGGGTHIAEQEDPCGASWGARVSSPLGGSQAHRPQKRGTPPEHRQSPGQAQRAGGTGTLRGGSRSPPAAAGARTDPMPGTPVPAHGTAGSGSGVRWDSLAGSSDPGVGSCRLWGARPSAAGDPKPAGADEHALEAPGAPAALAQLPHAAIAEGRGGRRSGAPVVPAPVTLGPRTAGAGHWEHWGAQSPSKGKSLGEHQLPV